MNRKPTIIPLLLASFAAATLPAIAQAEEATGDAPMCSLYEPIDKYQLLRRLSLDLRHRLPDYDEYRALESEQSVPGEVIEAYLGSDEFRSVVRRYHGKLLWPNISNVQLATVGFILRNSGIGPQGGGGGPNALVYLNNPQRSVKYRGGNNLHSCQDKLQTDIQPAYQLGEVPTCENVTDNGVDYCLEGYVEMTPYWESDSNKTIKLCAFEAQTTATATQKQGPPNGPGPVETVSCNDPKTYNNPACGCGPKASYCWGWGSPSEVLTEMEEQLMLTVDDHTVGGKPYSEMLTTSEVYSNERLAFFQRFLAPMSGPERTYNTWHEGDGALPANPDYTDTSWYATSRGGTHSGILTLPAYTLRFQTNRGRANRFRISFTNSYFMPSSEPDTEGCSESTDNLTERCTCRYCHVTLEPLAAHFATIAEAGTTLIDSFALDRPECVKKGGQKGSFDPWCDRFWITDEAADNPGRLITHQYANEVAAIQAGIDAGPRGLAQSIIADGSFARGTVQHVFKHFVGREMNLDLSSVEDETELLDELAAEFQASDDFIALITRIVQLDSYRRIR
jgi:hypothetical protein